MSRSVEDMAVESDMESLGSEEKCLHRLLTV